MIDVWLLKWFAGKRYIELITVKTFEELVPFKLDRSKYPKMEDRLLMEDIDLVKEKQKIHEKLLLAYSLQFTALSILWGLPRLRILEIWRSLPKKSQNLWACLGY